MVSVLYRSRLQPVNADSDIHSRSNTLRSIQNTVIISLFHRMATSVPHLSLTMDKKNPKDDIQKLVNEIRPKWKKFEITRFNDGLTNELYGVYENTDEEMVLVRIFGKGTELVIDRALERRTLKILSEFGCSKPLYATFDNGICYGYQEGEVLSEVQMRSDVFSELIAKEIARVHTLPIPDDYAPGKTRSHLFEGFPGLIQIIPDKLENAKKDEQFQRIRALMTNQELKEAVKDVEEQALSFGEPLVICHHDLLNRNMVYSKKENRVFFIDYEFAGLSYAPIDIAGHFLAYIGIDDPDIEHFPSEEKQFRFLKIYLQEKNRLQGIKDEVSDAEVAKWMRMVNKMLLVNHLFWGLYAILQEVMIEIDYPFLNGAELLLGAFCQFREQLTNL